MDFRSYARILLRRWLLIAVLAVLAAASAYGYTFRAPRLYRATAQLSVTPSIVEYWTGQAVESLLNNYALQLRSSPFAGQVAADSGGTLTTGDVAGRIKAVAAPQDFRIDLEVDDGDPARAAQIANAAATSFVKKINQDIAGKDRHDIQVAVLEPASTPGSPFSPRPRRDAAGGAILGALVGAALAFLLEFWDDSVRSAEEAAGVLALPVLGVIPHATTSPRTGVLHGFRPRRPAGRHRLRQAALAGRGGVSDASH